MERLTIEKVGSILVKDLSGGYTSPCFGCESLGNCVSKKIQPCAMYRALEKLKNYEDLEEQQNVFFNYDVAIKACQEKIGGEEISYKGFSIPGKSWYADAIGEKKEYIIIGMYTEDGGTQGEFRIEWEKLGIRLKAYNDSWETLSQMPESINLLAKIQRSGNEPSIEEFADLLKSLGYIDRTEYERSDA